MKNFITLKDFTRAEMLEIFQIADELENGGRGNALEGKTILMFFLSIKYSY